MVSHGSGKIGTSRDRASPTNPSHHAQLGTLFEQALEMPRPQRGGFVAEACGDNAALRADLISLLEAHDAAGDYFDNLAEHLVAPALSGVTSASDDVSASGMLEALQVSLAGSYRLERELGGGAMSRVFVAEDLKLKRHVVIKVLSPGMVPAASEWRFQREIEVAAQLQHPHIVPLHAADSAGGTSYYTMPFVAGETLRERLAREGPLPVEDATRIWRDILDALGHAHAHGIVHRDIKPGNILLSGRNALVTDFGIARAIETAAGDAWATSSGLAIGTPAYMAPEQANGDGDADQRVDIYAAGLVMYEMLAGSSPFSAHTPRDLLRAQLTREPPPLARPDAPETLLQLVTQCLAKDPAARPQHAADVLAQLDGATGTGITPAATRAAARVPGIRRFAPYAIAGLALVVMALALGLWRSFSGTVDEPGSLSGLAVLPLTSPGSDPGDAALADGMTQELISSLGKIPNLRVIASTSVTALQGSGLSVRQIADRLRVSHVIEVSLQKSGPRLRMHLRLVDARDESTQWSETYNREFAEVFVVQEEIARAVAGELASRLNGGTLPRTNPRRHTPGIAAYELYLRATDNTLLRSNGGLNRGIEYLEQAIAIDSTYAAAYAWLGHLYGRKWHAARSEDRARWFALAQQAAHKAVALDDADAVVMALLGWHLIAAKDFDGSEAAFRRALALDPGAPRAHEGLARVYMMTGRWAEQLVEARRGTETDPFSYSAVRELGLALATNGRCEEALPQLRSLKALSPPAAVAAVVSGQCYASRQQWPEAIAEFRWADDNGPTFGLAFLGFSLARAGRQDEAGVILSDLLSGRRESHGSFGIATVYAGMRDYDQAFAWLERAVDDNAVNAYIMHPIFADLHRDARFARVKVRLGLRAS
jgi:eukaryotic-like serine/threonine-protein kinase